MILAEMKNKLSSELNSEESKSIIEMVTGFDSMGQILNSKKEVSKEQEKEILEILCRYSRTTIKCNKEFQWG